MKTVIAIDSFKGSLTTFESGAAVAEGIRAVYPDAEVVISPMPTAARGRFRLLYRRRAASFAKLRSRVLWVMKSLPNTEFFRMARPL